jgi:tRNA (guanosine-2'-O-)-methyltransferase
VVSAANEGRALHEAVEIPMIGIGASLNVAVAGSLVLYKLAGMS